MIAGWVFMLVLTGIAPKDRGTWWLEVFPVMLAIPLLLYTREKFPLPRYITFWIFLHGLVLMIGGRYTYAEVPAGFWVQEFMGWSRNPYDRLGHLMQGFVPALIAREILFRQAQLVKPAWLFFVVVTVCMGVSVLYEFLEWAAALMLGQGADAFLGMQGDQWDTQWDMLLATVGAILAQLVYPHSKWVAGQRGAK